MATLTGKKDSVLYDDFRVVNSSNVEVTGLVAGDFTIYLYNPSNTEVSGSIPVSITELGNGNYRASYTPNATGLWFLMLIHATHFPEGKGNNHQIFDYDIDDKRYTIIPTPFQYSNIDLADTAVVFLGFGLNSSDGTAIAAAEITNPGVIYIDRKPKGGTVWTRTVSAASLIVGDGFVRYAEVFNSGTGYEEGDSIRVIMGDVEVTIDGITYIVVDSSGFIQQFSIRETGIKETYAKLPTDYIMGSSTQDSQDAFISRILGMAQENFRIYNQSYDSGGNMTSAKVRIYPTAADTDADTNAIATYTITATFSGVECTSYKVTKD